MKRYWLIFLFACGVFTSAFAQFSISGSFYNVPGIFGIDHVYLFTDLTTAEITYTGGKTPVNWYKFNDLSLSVSNLDYLSPEDATGYLLLAGTGSNKDSITVWILDYSQYQPQFTSLSVDETYEDLCTETMLKVEGNFPAMKYQTPSGTTRTLTREYTVSYQSLLWNNTQWNDTTTQETIHNMGTTGLSFTVPAPLCDTRFTLSGDQYAELLGLSPHSISTDLYSAIAVEAHPTTITTTRSAELNNELERPTEETLLEGSAPLDIEFTANANKPVALYYQWQILKGSAMLVQRSDETHRYTFTEAGDYTIRLWTSNSTCRSDSVDITVKVKESLLVVPNVFTPNGDGKNDEFRVLYKSIIEFHCWVYNNWGRKVFEWSDPAKGWDGTINGRKAAVGAYYYIIRAKGSDGVVYKLSGDINLIGR